MAQLLPETSRPLNDSPAHPPIVHVHQVSALDPMAIVQTVQHRGYCVLRGLVGASSVDAGRERLRASFNPAATLPSMGVTPDAVMQNAQKWSVGATSPRASLARLMMTFYNPLFCDDIYGLHRSFRTLVRLRNRMMEMPDSYAMGIENGEVFSGTRVQFYPSGGGFMGQHTDHVAASNVDGTGARRFIQLLLVMSKKGRDYRRGGGFVLDREGRRICVDDTTEIGDIVAYDGSSEHGVEDIDPDVVLRPDGLEGRFVGFATIYLRWRSGK